MGKCIQIVEVGPRDGFQNLKEYVPKDIKLKIIDGIVASGVKNIEITSFVSPKSIPQMKDCKEITRACIEKYPNVSLFGLVPNLYGARTAWDVGLKRINYVVSLSETHNKANINRTHKQSFDALKEIKYNYPNLDIELSLATVFGCPFEGKISSETAVQFLRPYIDLGIKSICLADTIGVANPKQVRELISTLKSNFPDVEFQIHIHDTRNMGMVSTLAAIECGIEKIQSTLGGLGGCPFAPGASGNTATEDLVYMLNEMEYNTGINFDAILKIAKYSRNTIEGNFSGHQIKI